MTAAARHRTPGGQGRRSTLLLLRSDLDRRLAVELGRLRERGWDVHLVLEDPDPHTSLIARRRALDLPELAAVVIGPYPSAVDGAARVARLRETMPGLPLVLLARAPVLPQDRVAAIRAGATAYLDERSTAGDWLHEVVRVHPAPRGRRRAPVVEPVVHRYADLVLDVPAHRVVRGGVEIGLTAREFALLECLLVNAERVCSRAFLLERVWGWDFRGSATAVDSCVRRLRAKVDRSPPPLLQGVRGVGYVLRTP